MTRAYPSLFATACLCAAPCLLVAALLLASANASAGFFKTITIDGDYSDWDDVPVVDSDAADNAGFVDFADTKIAHDDDFLYIYNSFHTAQSLGAFTALDVDSDVATGFDVFGLGLIGSEAGWQNDFPFTQDAGSFNNGSGMAGDFFGSGAALLTPFADGFERELSISLDIVFNAGGDVFADDTFSLLFWTDLGAGDVTGAIAYELTPIPEPTTLLLAAAGLASVYGRRRR
ncbi:MAG: PEP-CTERM sorting domain-containing protein [Planctomycetota bacterium]